MQHSSTPSTDSTAATSPAASFLERAKTLLQRTSLVVVPLAAAAATPDATAQTSPHMTSDYSVVGSYTNSGWFTGVFMDDASASASSTGAQTRLVGAKTVTDGMFWTYDSHLGYTRPGYDTTGIRYAWGGKLNGGVLSGDTLTADLNFTLSFEHTSTGEYDTPYVYYYLSVGYRTDPYTPESYQSGPAGYSGSQAYDSFYAAGTFDVSKQISSTFYDDRAAGEDLYWFVQLDVNWSQEFVSNSYWVHPNYSKLNGDELSVVFGDGLSSVNFNSTAAAIPEPAHIAGLFGLFAAGLLWWRRRQQAAVA